MPIWWGALYINAEKAQILRIYLNFNFLNFENKKIKKSNFQLADRINFQELHVENKFSL